MLTCTVGSGKSLIVVNSSASEFVSCGENLCCSGFSVIPLSLLEIHVLLQFFNHKVSVTFTYPPY